METRAVAVVAHPDDCVIFARPFMESYAHWQWKIVYLTYTPADARGHEIAQFWTQRNIAVEFLGREDHYKDLVTRRLSFDKDLAARDIAASVQGADLVLTHGRIGEYGHPHHKFVHRAVRQLDTASVYFCFSYPWRGANCEYTAGAVDLDQLPLHRSVIEGFKDRNHMRYMANDRAKTILGI